MKPDVITNRVMVFLVLLWLGGCGGGGGGSGSAPATSTGGDSGPVATPVGTPVGPAVSAVIGSDGGQLASSDGSVTLSVPAGVFADDTTITIQEISGNAPGHVGRAFRFSPEGLHTDMPMTISFHYTADDMQGTAPRFTSIAYQDAQGYWRVFNEPQHDEAAQTVSVQTLHFSDWSAVAGIQLRPGAASVETKAGLQLQIQRCEPEEVQDGPLATVSLMKKCDVAPLESFTAAHWSVNGVEGGGGDLGSIIADADVSTGIGHYHAPDYVPASNPVAVSVQVSDLDNPDDVTTLVSSVTIIQTLNCDSLKHVNAISADVKIDFFDWSDSTPDESYEGHQYGHLTGTMINQIPPAGRDASPIGYWTSQNQPHDGYVSMNDTAIVVNPDDSVTTSHAEGTGLPHVGMDVPSFITLELDYSTCAYKLAAVFTVDGTVTVDGVSRNAVIAPGGLYYSEILPADAIDTGTLQRDVWLPAKYDPDSDGNAYYPAGQSSVLRASGTTMGHWTLSVAN